LDRRSPQRRCHISANPDLTWTLPPDTTELKLLYDQSPNSSPSISYTSPISHKSFDDQADGTYYFHAQLKNKVGWGPITHYAVNIDQTQPTNLKVSELNADDASRSTAKFSITASDALSGLGHYELQINDQPAELWHDNDSHSYETPKLEAAAYTLKVKAFDKAGNYITAEVPFVIAPSAKLQSVDQGSGKSIISLDLLIKLGEILLLLALVALFIYGLWYGAHKLLALRSVVSPKSAISSKKISKAFELLRENMWKQVEMLHRASAVRELSSEEKLILKRLKRDLNKAEDILTR
jgi:hypothetical protein